MRMMMMVFRLQNLSGTGDVFTDGLQIFFHAVELKSTTGMQNIKK